MDAPASDADALGKAVGAKLLEMAGGRGFLLTRWGDAALCPGDRFAIKDHG